MSHIEEGRLHAYLDGECAEREIEQIETHLAICEECQERLEAATAASRTASDLLAEVEPGTLSAPSWRELEARAAARVRSTARRTWVKPSLAWAAMIAIAFGIGWFSNTYWSGSRYAPISGFRPAESPSMAADAVEADAVEEEQLPQAPTQIQAGEEREAERDVSNERVLYDDLRLKAASEVKSQPGRGAAAEGGIETVSQEEAVAARRRSQPTEDLARSVAAEVATRPPAEPSPAVAGVEARRELAEPRERQDLPADRALPEAETIDALAAQKSVLLAEADEAAPNFFAVQPEHAAVWLNGELRTLPDLELERVEVGPGNAVPGALPGLPAVRLVYEDAAGHTVTLIQQRVVDWAADAEAPVLSVDPSGTAAYRWVDARGYHLILMGNVSSDSLRALAERVR